MEFPERKQQYIYKISEINYIGAMQYTGMPGGTEVGRPCENKAISLAEQEDQRLWLMTVEDAERVFGEKKLAFLDCRRWVHQHNQTTITNGRPSWIEDTQDKYANWFARRYGKASYPGRTTLFKWWEEIINVTVRIAIARGCQFNIKKTG